VNKVRCDENKEKRDIDVLEREGKFVLRNENDK
jgi:hypothetical protein